MKAGKSHLYPVVLSKLRIFSNFTSDSDLTFSDLQLEPTSPFLKLGFLDSNISSKFDAESDVSKQHWYPSFYRSCIEVSSTYCLT